MASSSPQLITISARRPPERWLWGRKTFCLVLFDLDFFGCQRSVWHMFGDQVLQHVAQTVLSNTRSGDIAARIGGDEFLIFAEYKEEIEPFVQRIFHSLQGKFQDFQITVSMGVSLFPQNGADYEGLFHTADQALYSAKKNGRAQYHFYNESMHELLSVLSPMDTETGKHIEVSPLGKPRRLFREGASRTHWRRPLGYPGPV
ncbi:MAG: GGDEF domain-containing protein [Oscillospiraceae bacterium]